MSRRELTRAPVEVDMLDDLGMLNPTWETFFSVMSTYAFQTDKYSVSINPTSVSANTTSEQSFTVDGVSSNDFVLASKPSHTSGLILAGCRVSAKNQVSLTFANLTGSPIDPPSESYTIFVIKV